MFLNKRDFLYIPRNKFYLRVYENKMPNKIQNPHFRCKSPTKICLKRYEQKTEQPKHDPVKKKL